MSFTYQNDAVLDVIIIILFLNLKKMKSVNKKKKAKLSKGTTSLPWGLISFLFFDELVCSIFSRKGYLSIKSIN